MGKKGKKKKEKLTGTPDVVKFKGTREFHLLKELKNIQESIPFVASDILDDFSRNKVERFLNMTGLLSEFLQVPSKKDYRFMYHHQFLAPNPQYFPNGFSMETIIQAKKIMERPIETYNGKEYTYPEELRKLSEKFLREVDHLMTKIASFIEPALHEDFKKPESNPPESGLKQFKSDFKELLTHFDAMWTGFEREYVKARHGILTEVFAPVDKLVSTEARLTSAEEKLDVEAKQALEADFVGAVEEFVNVLYPATASEKFPADVIPLAEACIFYETKCTEEWLNLAKYLIKDYLELRIFVANIPQTRIVPMHLENQKFMRLLQEFHKSVIEASEALEFVAQLPKLIYAKSSNWMTRKLLEPDLQHIQKGGAFFGA